MVQRSSFSEHVEFPFHHGNPEIILVFSVEAMPEYYPYSVLISPGDPASGMTRNVVGHDVSYDRARIREEILQLSR